MWVQEETGNHVTLASVDQGYTGEETARDKPSHDLPGIYLQADASPTVW